MNTIGARLRIITICHALTGLLTAVWGAGLPALDARLDLGPGLIGVLLLIVAGCALVAMRVAGRIDRSGGVLLSAALPSAGVALVVGGIAPNLFLLLPAAALFGFACGAVNVALSAEAMAVETAIGRPVIARMHGFWTLGAAGGGMLLAAALHAGVESRIAISGAAASLTAASLVIGPHVRSTVAARTVRPHATVAADAPHAPSPFGRVHLIALGLLGAAVFFTEGAATDWSGVHATRALGADPAVGSVAYGVFFAAMTLVRFCGDSLRRRLGPVLTVRITSSVAVVGYALVLTSALLPTAPLAIATAIVGWALAGAGSALIWPIIIGTLATAGETRRTLAFVTMISYGGGLVGPAVIGVLAYASTLSIALMLPAALALVVAIAAPTTLRPARVHRGRDAAATPPNTNRTTVPTTRSTP